MDVHYQWCTYGNGATCTLLLFKVWDGTWHTDVRTYVGTVTWQPKFFRSMGYLGCLPFTPKNRKFPLENQMVRTIPFGTFRKKWAVVWGDPLFSPFSVFPGGERTIWQYSFGFDCFLCGQNRIAAKDKSDGRWKLHFLLMSLKKNVVCLFVSVNGCFCGAL